MASNTSNLDHFMQRILFVEPQPIAETGDDTPAAKSAERGFNYSLAFSAARCTLQYVVFPFILPVIGVASNAAAWIVVVLNIVAVISVVTSLRRFWQVGYKYRWHYTVFAVVILSVLSVFMVLDIGIILKG